MIKINGDITEFPEVEKGNDTLSYFLLKRLVKDAGLNLSKIVKIMNEQNPEHKTTPQNLSNKLSRDTLKVSEFIKLIEICGYTISFDRIAGELPKDGKKQKETKTYAELLTEGYADCDSLNFENIIIAGARAIEAAEWIKDNQLEGMDETQEIILLIAANRQFGVNCKPISSNPNTTFRMA